MSLHRLLQVDVRRTSWSSHGWCCCCWTQSISSARSRYVVFVVFQSQIVSAVGSHVLVLFCLFSTSAFARRKKTHPTRPTQQRGRRRENGLRSLLFCESVRCCQCLNVGDYCAGKCTLSGLLPSPPQDPHPQVSCRTQTTSDHPDLFLLHLWKPSRPSQPDFGRCLCSSGHLIQPANGAADIQQHSLLKRALLSS